MTNKEAKHFLETVQSINPEVADLIDAIEYAREYVPKIDHHTYHGMISSSDGAKHGVFRSNDYESRWFPGLDLRSVAVIIAEETL
jgi:hypothetical protein